MLEKKDKVFIDFLEKWIKVSVKILATLMVFVILWGVGDVVFVLYERLTAEPFMLLEITDILATFASFLAVLIAIEIFHNIVLYLKDENFPVKLVLATALMAVARKVIIFDYKNMDVSYVYATGVVILALGLVYYLLNRCEKHKG